MLLGEIERRVCDRRMLKLLRGWLRAGVFGGGIVSAIQAGTPQGSPISPLLANIALHVLDQAWPGGGQRLGVLVKYADDLVVLCATREQAEQARELVAAVLDMLGLRLHPAKTRIARLARGAEGFTLRGFEHRMRESWKQPGRWYLQTWPSRRAMASIRGKIRARTERRYARLPLEWAVEDLNRALRGLGQLLPLRQPRAEVRPNRLLRQRTPRDPRQRQAPTPRPQLRSPSQCPGTARSAPSAGRWLISTSSVTKPLPRPDPRADRSAIGTLVERTSRFVMLLHLPPSGDRDAPKAKNGPPVTGHGAEQVRDAIGAAIGELPEQLRRSLTWDQGAEMAQHAQLRIDTRP